MNTEKALRDRIKQDRRQFVAHRERIKDLEKEHQEARKLIVALIVAGGNIDIDRDGHRTHRLFLQDRQIALVERTDVFSISYDNKRMGNVYEVRR